MNRLRAWRNRLVPRTLVLCYHRIAQSPTDRFDLCVSPRHFSEHLRVLRELDLIVSFDHLGDALGARRLRRRTVVITFDDGYADNLHAAAPLLVEHGVHALFYICTGWIAQQREAWWDTLESIVLGATALPARLRLPGFERELDTVDRPALLDAVYPHFRDASPPDREGLVAALRSAADAPESLRPSHRPLTRAELRELAALPGLRIGSHTVDHPHLPSLPADTQEQEISRSIAWLEAELGRPIRDFSYPYGAFTAQTRLAAARAGVATAVTCEGRPAGRGGDPLSVPRVPVHDWDGAEFARRLQWSFTH